MGLNIFETLTIVNSILIAILPLAFFRRQKLQEIKYKEIMELNIKAHDITKRADNSLTSKRVLYKKDYDRLDYLISRFRKHSKILSNEIREYKKLWESATGKSKNGKVSKKRMNEIEKGFLNKSEIIRELADKLLN